MDIQNIILAVVLGLCVVFWFGPICFALHLEDQERKKRGEPPASQALFDERQTIIRLRASLHALCVLGSYLIAWAFLDAVGQRRGFWAWTGEVPVLAVGGLMLAALVWSVECELRDAAVGWNFQKKNANQPQWTVYSMMFVMCMNFGCLFLMGDRIALGVMSWLFAASFFVLQMAAAYAAHRRKKRDKGEEE